MKNLIPMCLVVLFLVTACKKEQDLTNTSSDLQSVGVDAQKQVQNIIIEGKLYRITTISSPTTDVMKWVDAPKEVTDFMQKYESTMIPHMIISKKNTYTAYYKDEDEMKKCVQFADSENKSANSRSLNGGKVTVWEHGTNRPAGYGNFISKLTSTWAWYQAVYNINAIQAFGFKTGWVGQTLNDRISVVDFEMINGEEPITFIGYEDAYDLKCASCPLNIKRVIITKLKASAPNGTWVGQNAIGLWGIRRNWYSSWNDQISAYTFYQAPVKLNLGIEIR